MCTVISESWELMELNKIKRKDESEEAWQARQAKAIAEINSHSLTLFHGLVQVYSPSSPCPSQYCCVISLVCSTHPLRVARDVQQRGLCTHISQPRDLPVFAQSYNSDALILQSSAFKLSVFLLLE